MPVDDRDYIRGWHPPTCTCTECVEKRLKRLRKEAHPNYISSCPICHKKSLWWNGKDKIYECLNLDCRVIGRSIEDIERYRPVHTNYPSPTKSTVSRIEQRSLPGYITFLLAMFALAFLSFGFWMLGGIHIDVGGMASAFKEVVLGSPYINQDGFEIYEHTQPPFAKADGTQIHLINNEIAVNPTWEQLKTFLVTDGTDQGHYTLGVRVCGDFAEDLHNNAEAVGIKAAFVSVELEGEDFPHALNVFQTTDRGVVFVDCTGEGYFAVVPIPIGAVVLGGSNSRDKVAYIRLGERFGLISLSVAEGGAYSYYLDWERKMSLFEAKDEEYKAELGYPEPGHIPSVPLAKYRRLMERLEELKELADALGGFWGSLGVVHKVSIYW